MKTGTKKAAFLWDESFLWGIMAYKALKGLGLPFDLIRAEDIKRGALDKYGMLFVPGGWASNKGKALGEAGRSAIQHFVANGGNYLGFCGGAGLATKAEGGIGLLNVKRRPTKERVPSFSGRIELNINEHQIWLDQGSNIFHAWWPSQFDVEDKEIKVLASYGKALPDSFSSDLNVGDTEANGGWKEHEEIYRINLDPERLIGEPSIIEGSYGKGKVILSLVHFDTPDDMNGAAVLTNLWTYLGGSQANAEARKRGSLEVNSKLTVELERTVNELIIFGKRNFLWFWRNPMLLQWRRGVRGLEYNTLYIMIKEITKEKSADNEIKRIMEMLIPFIEKAKKLLLLERQAMQKGHITYERCDDERIKDKRLELFSDSKSHGGMFKELIDEVDAVLFSLINREGR
ncbi:MAG: BPL-N domain-containing protein [Nitrospirota bacterium]